jgi:hypothetical protein
LATAFVNPLDDLGQRLLATNIDSKTNDFKQLASRCLSDKNKILGCDIVSSILRVGLETFDFKGMFIDDGHFIKFDMSNTLPLGLTITNTTFGELILPSAPPPRTTISNCLAGRVFGVAAQSGLPDWINKLEADLYDSVESVSRIRKIGLDPRHEILVTIVRKTFFQKGAGRKERGLTARPGKCGCPRCK